QNRRRCRRTDQPDVSPDRSTRDMSAMRSTDPSRPAAARALVLLLRAWGLVELAALLAVIMPRTWIAATHVWLGLGEWPEASIVIYLARIASLLYALHGALLLFAASDVERHGRLIKFLGMVALLQSFLQMAICQTAGLPAWWTYGDNLA